MSEIVELEHDFENKQLQELEIDLIPGTEIMKELEQVHFTANGKGEVLVPQPSNNKHDPLNWNLKWKTLVISGSFLAAFFQALGPLSVSAQVAYLMAEWNRSQEDTLQFTGICVLVFGFSNFIWVPLATKWGRRPSLLLSSILGIGASIWRARAQSYGSFMGAVVVHGIASGPSETLPNMIIVDTVWLQYRGTLSALYLLSYFGAYQLGPVFSGLMSQRYGWRTFWWLNVGGYVFLTLYLVFFLPETKWNRNAVDDSIKLETGNIEISKPVSEFQEDVEKDQQQQTLQASSSSDPIVVEHSDKWLYKGYPSKDQFKLVSPTALGYDTSIIRPVWVPIKIFAFPIIEWASFVFSFSASCFITINLTSTQVFQSPPYNFDATKVGYFNFALFVGTIFGVATSGPLSDYISRVATRRNNGIREAEMRLPALIPYTLIMMAGMLVVAYGYENSWRWEVIVILGYFFIGIQVASIPTIVNTYAIDCYKPIAGDYMVSATVNKNVWAYGVSKFLTPWSIRSGFVKPICLIMGLTVLFTVIGIPVYFWGKKLRRLTKNSSVHRC